MIHFLIQFLIFHCRILFDQNGFDFILFVETTNMKKCRYKLFQRVPGHAHNPVSSSGNFCDRFLAFLHSSTFKTKKRTSIVQNLVLRKDDLIVLQNTQIMSNSFRICNCFQSILCGNNTRTNTYKRARYMNEFMFHKPAGVLMSSSSNA